MKRTLHVESLENRHLLTGAPIADHIQLVAADPDTGDLTAYRNSQTVPVTSHQHPAAANGVLVPLLGGDFNNDGVTDLLSEDAEQNRWWLQLNDGTQLFELYARDGLPGVEIIGTADFNQDDMLDVASIDRTTNDLWISLYTEDGFMHEVWGRVPTGSALSEIHIGDFNGDDLPDILTAVTDELFRAAINNAGAGFDIQDWGSFQDFNWMEVLSGNFNNDEFADVVALAPDYTWWIWQGTPTGFGSAQYFGHWKMATGWMDIGAADFSGDGIDDVIGRTPDGKLRVGTATPGGFHTWVWGSGWINSADWSRTTILDLDDDDLPDQISQARDGTWWYAINDGGSFSNYFYQRAPDVDFILPNFRNDEGVSVIDSMPDGGVDVRNLEIYAELNAANLIEIGANGPLQIDGITFHSPGGSLVPSPPNGGAALSGATMYDVAYGPVVPRFAASDTLRLDVGWVAGGTADLVADLEMSSNTFPIQVEPILGPMRDNPDIAAPVANEIYFNTLPNNQFLRRGISEPEVDGSTANTVSFSDARLRVELDENNRMLLTPAESLTLTGVELRSESGSLVPIGNGGTDEPADPFLNLLINSSSRIIFDSLSYPLPISDPLTLDVSWSPISTTKDLVVEYRVAGDDTVYAAHVDARMRLPYVDPNATPQTVLGPVRIV